MGAAISRDSPDWRRGTWDGVEVYVPYTWSSLDGLGLAVLAAPPGCEATGLAAPDEPAQPGESQPVWAGVGPDWSAADRWHARSRLA